MTTKKTFLELRDDFQDLADRFAKFAKDFSATFETLTPDENEKRIAELLDKAGLERRPKGRIE